jgi:hypothetical protein
VFQFGFSQVEKSIIGKVSCDNVWMPKVDVINKTAKKSTTTNENGEFVILAKAHDSLFFYIKGCYIKMVKLKQEQIGANDLFVTMLKKPEELEEVIIAKRHPFKLSLDKEYEQAKLDRYALDKAASAPKVEGVYTGVIENGLNFVAIGSKIIGLFIKEKKPVVKGKSLNDFKKRAESVCSRDFFISKLVLKSEDIALFLEFCDADPRSKIVVEENNALSLMDFLFSKNREFKKL